jgi:hypothetical protein
MVRHPFGIESPAQVIGILDRNHSREAYMRAGDSGLYVLRAPPKRASGEVRFLLTKTYMDVGKSGILHGCPPLVSSDLFRPLQHLIYLIEIDVTDQR